MNVLQSIIYGLVSGLSGFLPISSQGHQGLLRVLFGVSTPEPIRDILVHIGLLCAVFVSCGTYIEKIRRELRVNSGGRGRRERNRDRRIAYDLRFFKNTAAVVLAVSLIIRLLVKSDVSLGWIALFFLINGILVYIPEYMPHGNKDTKSMSALDAFLIGLFGGLSALPGISCIGASVSCAIARGADKNKAYGWMLLLSIPAIILWIAFDFVSMFVVGIGAVGFLTVLGYILSAIFAFVSAMAGIYLMRFIVVRSGFCGFAFYSWGAALLSFLLYLSA